MFKKFLETKRREKQMKEEREKKTIKAFILKRVSVDDAKSLICDQFQDSSNYLDVNDSMIIGIFLLIIKGRKIRGPRFDEDRNIISHSIVGKPEVFEATKKANRTNGLKGFVSKVINLNKIIETKQTKEKNSMEYETILDKDIELIYNGFKSGINPENDENDEINLPTNVKKILEMQENNLNQIKIKEKYSDSLSKYLAKKSNKKEEDLLFKKIDMLRIRKELNELTSKNNSSECNLPHSGNWILNLRSQKNTVFPDIAYLNYGAGTNPYYVPIRERRNKSVDIIRDPKSTSILDSRIINSNKELMDNKLNIYDRTLNCSTMNFIQSLNSKANNTNNEDLNVTFKKTTNETSGINSLGVRNSNSNLIVIKDSINNNRFREKICSIQK